MDVVEKLYVSIMRAWRTLNAGSVRERTKQPFSRRDSRVYNAKLIELISCRSCRRGLLAIYHGITVQIRQPRVEPSVTLSSPVVGHTSPFPRGPARAMGAAITSCVNKHSSSRWLTPNSSQYPRGSVNRHHPFSLMFLPKFYSLFFLWSRGINFSAFRVASADSLVPRDRAGFSYDVI